MAVAPSFPLFRLPNLAYENVIEFLHLKEKFNLAAVSKKVFVIIQRDKRIKKHRLILFICFGRSLSQIRMGIDRGVESKAKDINSWKYDHGDERNAVVEPMIAQITHIAKVSQNILVSIKFIRTGPGMLPTFVPLVKRLNLTLDWIEADEDGGPRDDICRYVFEECGHANNLAYSCLTTYDFSLDSDLLGPFSFKSFQISQAPWLTVNHVKKWLNNCESVQLNWCWYSAVEVNSFLKNWIEESKIQKFGLIRAHWDFALAEALNGIPAVPHDYIYDKEEKYVANGYIIKQTNGVEALVYMCSRQFYLTTKFEIVDEFFIEDQIYEEEEYESNDED